MRKEGTQRDTKVSQRTQRLSAVKNYNEYWHIFFNEHDMKRLLFIQSAFLLLWLGSCSTSGPGVFTKRTPHEQYAKSINDAGLQSTALGRSWFAAAEQGISNPLTITIPYKETGYFAAERPSSLGLKMQAVRGEKIFITLSKKPVTGFIIYLDLLRRDDTDSSKTKLVASADSADMSIRYEVDRTAVYILRLQPELLQSGEYTLTITRGPSLAYPLKAPGRNHTQSFWGASRDAGVRRHEGIDMFAPKRTPVIAIADGRVTRVNQNRLGGNVVWMHPDQKDYTLYYAHLDTQLVKDGQAVRLGDTLGLVGNTGNAEHTAPHLHFGIYTSGGAIDPFPFVDPVIKDPENISADTDAAGKRMRVSPAKAAVFLEPAIKSPAQSQLTKNTVLIVEGAHSVWYRVLLPDGSRGYISNKSVTGLQPIRSLQLDMAKQLLNAPDSTAASKKLLTKGSMVKQLGLFKDFQLIVTDDNMEGWIKL